MSRCHTDREGNWKSSQSFGKDEMPLAVYCLRMAFERIIEEEQVQGTGVEEEVPM